MSTYCCASAPQRVIAIGHACRQLHTLLPPSPNLIEEWSQTTTPAEDDTCFWPPCTSACMCASLRSN